MRQSITITLTPEERNVVVASLRCAVEAARTIDGLSVSDAIANLAVKIEDWPVGPSVRFVSYLDALIRHHGKDLNMTGVGSGAYRSRAADRVREIEAIKAEFVREFR